MHTHRHAIFKQSFFFFCEHAIAKTYLFFCVSTHSSHMCSITDSFAKNFKLAFQSKDMRMGTGGEGEPQESYFALYHLSFHKYNTDIQY